MKTRWTLTTVLLLALPSCLEQTRLTCPSTVTLNLKRGESVTIPDVCTTHANAPLTWDLAAREVAVVSAAAAGLPDGIELEVDAAVPSQAALRLRESAQAPPDSTGYDLRLSAAPRYFRDGDVERACVDNPSMCGVSNIALRVNVVDEVPFGVDIVGVPADGQVPPEQDVTLTAAVVGGSGHFAYAWEGWTLVTRGPIATEEGLPPSSGATPIVVAEMDESQLALGRLGPEPQLYVVAVTDLDSGEVTVAHRFVRSLSARLDVAVSGERYPGAPVALSCLADPSLVPGQGGLQVERTICTEWYLQRADNVPTGEIDAVAIDPLQLPAVRWSGVPLPAGPDTPAEVAARVNGAIVGREGLYRIVVFGRDRLLQNELVTVALLPRHY